jgi:hypothetical protein
LKKLTSSHYEDGRVTGTLMSARAKIGREYPYFWANVAAKIGNFTFALLNDGGPMERLARQRYPGIVQAEVRRHLPKSRRDGGW